MFMEATIDLRNCIVGFLCYASLHAKIGSRLTHRTVHNKQTKFYRINEPVAVATEDKVQNLFVRGVAAALYKLKNAAFIQ